MIYFRPNSIGTLSLTTLLFLSLLATTASLESENWPSFRGPDALSTVGDDPLLPVTWSSTENVVWKTPVQGLGWSSPVIWEDHIFVTTVINEGEEEEPRMGLYFPYGSPETMVDPRFPDPKKGTS